MENTKSTLCKKQITSNGGAIIILADKIIELRKATGTNRKVFCEYFEIPYRTVTDWELGNRSCPDYVLRLLEYYIQMNGLAKNKGDK